MNPSGFCKCGCGEKTSVATRTRPYLGTVRGEHIDFLPGHSRTVPAIVKFRRYTVPQIGGCWTWTGARMTCGYGTLLAEQNGKTVLAHRWSYEHFVGPIPAGYDVDHLCRNRACVNPEHLEPVPHAVNVERGIPHRTLKLSSAERRTIIEAIPYRGYKQELADRFGITPSYVKYIRREARQKGSA